jgi:N-acyl-D-aspartate/D-glutamate deacylase
MRDVVSSVEVRLVLAIRIVVKTVERSIDFPDGDVIVPFLSERNLIRILQHPAALIASEGVMANGKGHPRTGRTFSRVLGHYVRETRILTLGDAYEK